LRRWVTGAETGTAKERVRGISPDEAARQIHVIFTSLYEAYEVNRIYRGLRALAEYVGAQRLREILGGQFSYVDEGAHNAKARNASFELVVAACLSSCGFTLKVAGATDVCVEFDGHHLLFECKRPQSANSLDENVDEALKQLRHRMQALKLPLMRGFVAIDVSKVVNPHFVVHTGPSLGALMDELQEILIETATDAMRRRHDPGVDDILGGLFRFSGITRIEGDGTPLYTELYTLVDATSPDNPCVTVMRNFAKVFTAMLLH
jgi:hypothetical protein